MSDDKPEVPENLTEEEFEEALKRGSLTRVESYGELVFEPGMSREESLVRRRDILWRHGGAERARTSAEFNVSEGRWTREQAAAHLARLSAQAEGDRDLVRRCDEARAKQGVVGHDEQGGS